MFRRTNQGVTVLIMLLIAVIQTGLLSFGFDPKPLAQAGTRESSCECCVGECGPDCCCRPETPRPRSASMPYYDATSCGDGDAPALPASSPAWKSVLTRMGTITFPPTASRFLPEPSLKPSPVDRHPPGKVPIAG